MITEVETAAATYTPPDLPQRPAPERIDDLVRDYLHGEALLKGCAADQTKLEDHLRDLVQTWGFVPPNAEMSRRLLGILAEITVTRSNTINLKTDSVDDLQAALEAMGLAALFEKLFALQPRKYETVRSLDEALKDVKLSKRRREKVTSLYGRCFDVKPKKASFKAVIADPAKPAKKRRAKKAGK